MGVVMSEHEWPARRATCPDVASCSMPLCVCPPMAAECGTDVGAEPTGVRAPLPNSVGRWARVLIGGIVLLFAAIGAIASLGAAWQYLTTDSSAKAAAPAKVTT